MSGEPPSNPELRDAMTRVADGDRTAFHAVFAALWEPVLRFCSASLGTGADAEDAAQESLTRLMLQADRYDRSRPVLAWALAIAHWQCRTVRQRGRRDRTVPLDPAHDTASAQTPATLHEQEALLAAAHHALALLSESDQQAILAGLLETIPRPDVDPATFRKRKQRAVERLRDAWRYLYGD
jgi:RNA polymerase sigma factor (sigma-70 family)